MTRRMRGTEANVGLWAELRRRNVVRMALLYCVASSLVFGILLEGSVRRSGDRVRIRA